MAVPLDFNRFFNAYKKAVFNKDVGALMELYDEDFIAFDMWGAWSHIGAGPWREVNRKWLTTLGSESVLVEFEDIRVIPGNDVAAASATVSYKALSQSGEILRSMQNRLTWVAKQTDGDWKIVHQHTSAPQPWLADGHPPSLKGDSLLKGNAFSGRRARSQKRKWKCRQSPLKELQNVAASAARRGAKTRTF